MESTEITNSTPGHARMLLERAFGKFNGRFSEIVLGALLALSVAVFTYSLNAQAKMAERVRLCETQTALNTQSVSGLKEAIEKTETTLTLQICLFVEMMDRRFQSLERILNKALETNR